LDETGYVLVSANELRLLDAHPCHLSRTASVDWAALLGIMATAAEQGRDAFREAVRTQERLFATKPIFLGVEESLRHPEVPCGLRTDSERGRHVRKRFREILNSRGGWEPMRESQSRPVREILTPENSDAFRGDHGTVNEPASGADQSSLEREQAPRLIPILSIPAALEKVGVGTLCLLSEDGSGKIYGKALTVAERLGEDRVILAKWVRRLTQWNGRQESLTVWREKVLPCIEQRLAGQKTPVVSFQEVDRRMLALVSIAELSMRVPVDSYGVPIWRPVEREVLPADCVRCALVPVCCELPTSTGVALLWRRLGLVNAAGVPTRRGRIVSFFSQGDGLAIAVALEDESYPLEELVYDLANLDGGFRFCGDDNRWAGRLANVCHEKFGLQSIPGYLENGVPPKYGVGAEQVVAAVHRDPANKHAWVTDLLGAGDIDRAIIEWRSLLRQIAHAPELEWPRWQALQSMARTILDETESPTVTDLPPLEYLQTKRVDHRLFFRRH
jgi:hypothetical protein